jgi:hypothetical protein
MSEPIFNISLNPQSVKDAVDTEVHAAIASVLGKDSDKLVAAVVKEAMSGKSRNSYSTKSIFAEAVENLIRTEAQAAVQEWVDEKRPQIRKALSEAITRKEGLVDQLVDGMVKGLSSNFYFSATATSLDAEKDY